MICFYFLAEIALKCVMVQENSIGMAMDRHSYYLDSAAKKSLSTHKMSACFIWCKLRVLQHLIPCQISISHMPKIIVKTIFNLDQ